VTAPTPTPTPPPGEPPESVSRRYKLWLGAGIAAIGLLLGLSLWGMLGWEESNGSAQHAALARTHCALPEEPATTAHPGMVWVGGGRYEFGDTVYAEEQPVRMVTVEGFWMDRTEVTNDAFARFVTATGYVTLAERPVDARLHPNLPADMQQPGAVVFTQPITANTQSRLTQWWRYIPGAQWRHPEGPNSNIGERGSHPVVAVAFEDALAYARWRGSALPTEVQWEWAARAGQVRSGQDHAQPQAANTWQGLFPVVNTLEDGFAQLAPVGCYAANALGLMDMIGNAWELTADAYRPDHTEAPDEVAAPASADVRRSVPVGQRVIKGGSFLCAPSYCKRYRSSARQPQDEDLGTSHVGFRTILKAPGP